MKKSKTLEILINRNCNYNCNYCSIKDNSIKENLKKIDNLEKLINNNNISKCSILGGEPLINPNITNIINFIVSLNIELEVYTNGSIIPPRKDNINYIISWHPSMISKKIFIEQLKNFPESSEIHIMYHSTNKTILDDFLEIKKIHKGEVYLEPVFLFDNNILDSKEVQIFKDKGLMKYSKVLSFYNSNINKYFDEVLLQNNKYKICNINSNNISYDFYKEETYQCLSFLLSNNKSRTKICKECCICADSTYLEDLI